MIKFNMIKLNQRSMAGLLVVAVVFGIVLGVAGMAVSKASRVSTIGYIRVEDITSNWPEFQKANSEFSDYVTQLQNEYKPKLDKASDSEKDTLWQEMQDKMQNKNDEMVKPYDEVLNKAIEEVRKARGIDTVLPQDMVIAGGVDLTDAVFKSVIQHSDEVKSSVDEAKSSK